MCVCVRAFESGVFNLARLIENDPEQIENRRY